MFYRVTKYNFDEDRFDEQMAWAETVRESIESIAGFHHAHVFRSAPGEAMIVAAYEDEASFEAASETVMAVLAGMAEFMTSEPHTHSGTVDLSYGR
jgi:heme-degrading monooxygenase HmoA